MIRPLAAISLVVAAPLCAQTASSPPPAVAELKAPDNSAEHDDTYRFHVRAGDGYELASSRLALQRSRNRAVRRFAQTMIAHHTRSAADLARIGGPPLRPGLGEPKEQMLQKLRASTGAKFDSDYIQGQLAAHQEALELHRTYVASGRNAALRQFATRAQAVVQDHLARVRALSTWRR